MTCQEVEGFTWERHLPGTKRWLRPGGTYEKGAGSACDVQVSRSGFLAVGNHRSACRWIRFIPYLSPATRMRARIDQGDLIRVDEKSSERKEASLIRFGDRTWPDSMAK